MKTAWAGKQWFASGAGVTGATGLGASEDWPSCLKVTLGILFHSRQPMVLWWGPDSIQFYNDAFLPGLPVGAHPSSFGQPGEQCWGEHWPTLSTQIDEVMAGGRPSWNEDHLVPIFRDGCLEEVYWSYSCSAVLDEVGAVAGTLAICTETTARVLAERRLRTLEAVARAAGLAQGPDEVLQAFGRVLTSDTRDTPFALSYRFDARTGGAVLAGTAGLKHGESSRLDPQAPARLVSLYERAVRGQKPLPIPGAEGLFPALHRDLWPEPISDVCLVAAEQGRGFLVFGLNPRLPFNDRYREYVGQLASQLGGAFRSPVSHAGASAVLRLGQHP